VIQDAIDHMAFALLPKPKPAGPGVGTLVKHGVGNLIGTEETLQTVVSEPLIFCSIMGHTHRYDGEQLRHKIICQATAMIAGSVRFHPPQMFAVEAFCQSLERATKIADVLEFPLFHDRPDWASERGQVVQLIRSNVAGRWEAVSISSRHKKRTCRHICRRSDWLDERTE